MLSLDDLKVLLSLKDLQTFLDASSKLDTIVEQNSILMGKYDALYGRYSELLEAVGQIRKEL